MSIDGRDELPTSIFGTISYGNDPNIFLDFTDRTIPRTQGFLNESFSHTFTTPDEYNVTVWLYNEISQIRKTVKVNFKFFI